jgi:hypothetical protein
MQKLKVAIIGAGPSGFGVAEILRQKSLREHFDITIYESNDHVGGKCWTILEEGTSANSASSGHEVGAGFIPKYARSYADFMRIIKKYDIKLRKFQRASELLMLQDGAASTTGQLSAGLLVTNPSLFFKIFADYVKHAVLYARYGSTKHIGYTNLPKALTRPLPLDHNDAMFLRFAHVMQGFGYADMDDPYLRPPLAYYYRYLELTMRSPLYMVEGGTQSIWEKVAETYPQGTIRLNEAVLRVKRTPEKVIITTANDVATYDYLVVATPLKAAQKYLDITKQQKEFMSQMKYNHYITVLCKASGIKEGGTFNLSACSDRERLDQVFFSYKQDPNSDTVTLNLFIKPGDASDDKTILDNVDKSLPRDFGAKLLDKRKAKIFHWDDYFGHLGSEDLASGWYDDFEMDYQDKNRTLFVSSGLHMETIGASIQYATKVTKKYAKIWLAKSLETNIE